MVVDENWQQEQGSTATIGASVTRDLCALLAVKYKQTHHILSKSTYLSVDDVGYNMWDNTKAKDKELKSDG